MKTIAVAITAAAGCLFINVTPSAAYEGPWCVKGGGRGTMINICRFRTFQECLQERQFWGNATCTQNPYYYWDARTQRWRKPPPG